MPYDHVQVTPADPWVIEHNLGCKPFVQVYTNEVPGQNGLSFDHPLEQNAVIVQYLNGNVCTVSFGGGNPKAGRARLV